MNNREKETKHTKLRADQNQKEHSVRQYQFHNSNENVPQNLKTVTTPPKIQSQQIQQPNGSKNKNMK